MVLAADIYAKNLSYLRYGLPLWIPEPSEYGEAHIGDVGYVLNGSFYRMFNVMRSPDDPLNQWGVPESFQKLEVHTRLLHRVPKMLEAGVICSRSVRKTHVEFEAGSDVAFTSAGYRFTCTEDQGALLILNGDASVEEIHPGNSGVAAYMQKHHSSWCEFAFNQYGLTLKLEEISLVRGWVKTSDWAVAAFLDRGTAHDVSFQADAGPLANAKFSVSRSGVTSSSVQHRTGRTAEHDPDDEIARDQCVFLSVYKMKRRYYLLPRVVAAAEPTNDDTRDYASDSEGVGVAEMEVEIDSPIEPVWDPLDVVLDYIMENSDAEMAIASHDALKLMPQEWSVDEGLSDTLRVHRPAIVLDSSKVGMLHIEAFPVDLGCPSPPRLVIPPHTRSPTRSPTRSHHYRSRRNSQPELPRSSRSRSLLSLSMSSIFPSPFPFSSSNSLVRGEDSPYPNEAVDSESDDELPEEMLTFEPRGRSPNPSGLRKSAKPRRTS